MNGRERQAAALAFMRTGEHDIRPDLLLFVVEKDDERFPKLFCYGCNYLAIRYAKAEMLVPEDAIQIAVVDALEIMKSRKASYTLKERAQELRLRAQVFGALRKTAIRLFEQRLEEAQARFRAALRGSDFQPDLGKIKVRATNKRDLFGAVVTAEGMKG